MNGIVIVVLSIVMFSFVVYPFAKANAERVLGTGMKNQTENSSEIEKKLSAGEVDVPEEDLPISRHGTLKDLLKVASQIHLVQKLKNTVDRLVAKLMAEKYCVHFRYNYTKFGKTIPGGISLFVCTCAILFVMGFTVRPSLAPTPIATPTPVPTNTILPIIVSDPDPYGICDILNRTGIYVPDENDWFPSAVSGSVSCNADSIYFYDNPTPNERNIIAHVARGTSLTAYASHSGTNMDTYFLVKTSTGIYGWIRPTYFS